MEAHFVLNLMGFVWVSVMAKDGMERGTLVDFCVVCVVGGFGTE